MDVREAIRSRRTHKQFGDGEISRETVEELLELARWAPNHRLTNPWRFAVLLRPALDRFQQFVLENVSAICGKKSPESIREKAQTLLPSLGALIVVGCVRNPAPEVAREDFAACACACQNILLGATAQGLATFWSTGTMFCSAKSAEFYGLGEGVDLVGAICLGTPVKEPQGIREPLEGKVRWL
jgi:nitroreductase